MSQTFILVLLHVHGTHARKIFDTRKTNISRAFLSFSFREGFVLTLRAPTKIAAGDTLFFYFDLPKETRLDV